MSTLVVLDLVAVTGADFLRSSGFAMSEPKAGIGTVQSLPGVAALLCPKIKRVGTVGLN